MIKPILFLSLGLSIPANSVESIGYPHFLPVSHSTLTESIRGFQLRNAKVLTRRDLSRFSNKS